MTTKPSKKRTSVASKKKSSDKIPKFWAKFFKYTVTGQLLAAAVVYIVPSMGPFFSNQDGAAALLSLLALSPVVLILVLGLVNSVATTRLLLRNKLNDKHKYILMTIGTLSFISVMVVVVITSNVFSQILTIG